MAGQASCSKTTAATFARTNADARRSNLTVADILALTSNHNAADTEIALAIAIACCYRWLRGQYRV